MSIPLRADFAAVKSRAAAKRSKVSSRWLKGELCTIANWCKNTR
jgi:hypothetical protein